MKTDQWILIAKKLSGELTSDEQKQFEHWISSNVENQTLFTEAQKIWEATGRIERMEFEPETALAWTKLQTKINAPKVIKMQPVRYSWLQIAASVILVMTFSFLVRYILKDKTEENIAHVDEVDNTVIDSIETTRWDSATFFYLPDRTRVALNKGSKLAYPIQFIDSVRIVTLTGEAFFNVRHDAGKPFIIKAGNSEIRVLGTSFNVRAFQSEGNVQVTVYTGKVLFTTKDSSGIVKSSMILTPDEQVTFTKKSGTVQVNNDKPKSKLYMWWKTAKEQVDRDIQKVIKKKNRPSKDKD